MISFVREYHATENGPTWFDVIHADRETGNITRAYTYDRASLPMTVQKFIARTPGYHQYDRTFHRDEIIYSL